MPIEKITADDLRDMEHQEGLVLQGCGGEAQEWLDGINDLLTQDGILQNGSRFETVKVFQHDGLNNLLFPFENIQVDTRSSTMSSSGRSFRRSRSRTPTRSASSLETPMWCSSKDYNKKERRKKMAIFMTDTHGYFGRLRPAAFREQGDLSKDNCRCRLFGHYRDNRVSKVKPILRIVQICQYPYRQAVKERAAQRRFFLYCFATKTAK